MFIAIWYCKHFKSIIIDELICYKIFINRTWVENNSKFYLCSLLETHKIALLISTTSIFGLTEWYVTCYPCTLNIGHSLGCTYADQYMLFFVSLPKGTLQLGKFLSFGLLTLSIRSNLWNSSACRAINDNHFAMLLIWWILFCEKKT